MGCDCHKLDLVIGSMALEIGPKRNVKEFRTLSPRSLFWFMGDSDREVEVKNGDRNKPSKDHTH